MLNKIEKDCKRLKSIIKDFTNRIRRLIKEALNMQDSNQFTPLHMSSSKETQVRGQV